jgi:hypothetical protein
MVIDEAGVGRVLCCVTWRLTEGHLPSGAGGRFQKAEGRHR